MDQGLDVSLKIWQDINLSSLQKSLDDDSARLLQHQQDSVAAKKKLAEQTKQFRKLESPEQKLAEFRNLLKAYQQEIDAIAQRSKQTETAYLNIYKLLAEAPDPAPLLSAVVERSKQLTQQESLQIENRQLTDQISSLNTELASSRAAEKELSVLKQRLSSYEAKLDEMVQEKVTAKESELRQEMDDKIAVFKETEYALDRQLQQTKEQVKAMLNSHDATQARLTDDTQKFDDNVAAKLAELEVVLMDLEQSQLKIAELSNENKRLRAKLDGQDDESRKKEMLEREREQSIEEKARSLEEQLNRLKETVNENSASFEVERNDFRMKITSLESKKKSLESKLSKLDDYSKLKRDYDVLRAIAFPNEDEDGTDRESDALDADSYSLEKMMMDRNKRLADDLTGVKIAYNDTMNELDHVKSELQLAVENGDKQARLVAKLEEDLRNLNTSAYSVSDSLTGIENTSSDPLSQIENRSIMSLEQRESLKGDLPATTGSIIPILTSQRDRYRQRNSELEEMQQKQLVNLNDLNDKLTSLQNDNLKLYEKLKYTQSFNNSVTPSVSSDNSFSSYGGAEKSMHVSRTYTNNSRSSVCRDFLLTRPE